MIRCITLRFVYLQFVYLQFVKETASIKRIS